MKKIMKVIAGFVFLYSVLIPKITYAISGTDFTTLAPFPKGTSLTALIVHAVNWIVIIAGMLAVIYLIYGGITYIMAAGNEDKIKQGKTIIINAIIGIVIILVSLALVRWVGTILSASTTY